MQQYSDVLVCIAQTGCFGGQNGLAPALNNFGFLQCKD